MKLVSRVVMLLFCDPPSNFHSCTRNIIVFQGQKLSTKWFLQAYYKMHKNDSKCFWGFVEAENVLLQHGSTFYALKPHFFNMHFKVFLQACHTSL